jgi:hypothetical protein
MTRVAQVSQDRIQVHFRWQIQMALLEHDTHWKSFLLQIRDCVHAVQLHPKRPSVTTKQNAVVQLDLLAGHRVRLVLAKVGVDSGMSFGKPRRNPSHGLRLSGPEKRHNHWSAFWCKCICTLVHFTSGI